MKSQYINVAFAFVLVAIGPFQLLAGDAGISVGVAYTKNERDRHVKDIPVEFRLYDSNDRLIPGASYICYGGSPGKIFWVNVPNGTPTQPATTVFYVRAFVGKKQLQMSPEASRGRNPQPYPDKWVVKVIHNNKGRNCADDIFSGGPNARVSLLRNQFDMVRGADNKTR